MLIIGLLITAALALAILFFMHQTDLKRRRKHKILNEHTEYISTHLPICIQLLINKYPWLARSEEALSRIAKDKKLIYFSLKQFCQSESVNSPLFILFSSVIGNVIVAYSTQTLFESKPNQTESKQPQNEDNIVLKNESQHGVTENTLLDHVELN